MRLACLWSSFEANEPANANVINPLLLTVLLAEKECEIMLHPPLTHTTPATENMRLGHAHTTVAPHTHTHTTVAHTHTRTAGKLYASAADPSSHEEKLGGAVALELRSKKHQKFENLQKLQKIGYNLLFLLFQDLLKICFF